MICARFYLLLLLNHPLQENEYLFMQALLKLKCIYDKSFCKVVNYLLILGSHYEVVVTMAISGV